MIKQMFHIKMRSQLTESSSFFPNQVVGNLATVEQKRFSFIVVLWANAQTMSF